MPKVKVVLVAVIDANDAYEVAQGFSDLAMQMKETYGVSNWAVSTFRVNEMEFLRRFICSTKTKP